MSNRIEPAADQDTTDGLKDRIGDAADQVKDKARELTHKAGEKARTRVGEEKDRVSGGMRTMADALRKGSHDLPGDRDQYAPLLNKVADRIESASGYLDSRDIDMLTHDARRFVRQHTPLFLGGAFVLGVLGARFLKSSSDSVRDDSLRGYDRPGSMGRDLSDRHDTMQPVSGSTFGRQAPGFSPGGASRGGMTDTTATGPRSMAASPASDSTDQSHSRPSAERNAERDDRGSNG